MRRTKKFDVFISYCTKDLASAEALATDLQRCGLELFFDRWHLVPGEPWQEALEEALQQSRSCAVLIGSNGLGSWATEELRAALNMRARDRVFRVIPVIPETAEDLELDQLPLFLHRFSCVDFRSLPRDEALRRLVSGINGKAPGPETLPAWLRVLLRAGQVELRAPDVRREGLEGYLLEIAFDLTATGVGSDKVILVLNSEHDGAEESGVYRLEDKKRLRLIEAIREPSVIVLFWWVTFLTQRGRREVEIKRWLQSLPSGPRLEYERLSCQLLDTRASSLFVFEGGRKIKASPTIKTPSAADLLDGSLGPLHDSSLRTAFVALEHEDYSTIERILTELDRGKGAPDANWQLLSAILELSRGKASRAEQIIAEVDLDAGTPELRIWVALVLLRNEQNMLAELMVKGLDEGFHHVLRHFVSILKKWIKAALAGWATDWRSSNVQSLDEIVNELEATSEHSDLLWFCLVRIAIRLGDYTRAQRWLKHVQTEDSNHVEHLHLTALIALNSVVHKRLTDPHRGFSKRMCSKLNRANELLEKAVELAYEKPASSKAELWKDLAVTRELLATTLESDPRRAQFASAAEAFDHAAKLASSSYEIYPSAARCWLLAGCHERALDVFSKLEADLLSPLSQSDLAAAQLLSGRPDQALETLVDLLDQETVPWQALLNAGIVLHLAGNGPEAELALRDARPKAGSGRWQVEFLLGMVYASLGETDKAEDAYGQSIRARGLFDSLLHAAYLEAFQAGTRRHLSRLTTWFRRALGRQHAKLTLLDDLDQRSERTISRYKRLLSDYGPEEPSDLLSERFTQVFYDTVELRKVFHRLDETRRTRGSWPIDALSEQLRLVVTGRKPSTSDEGEVPPGENIDHPFSDPSSWAETHSAASEILRSLSVEVELDAEDTRILSMLTAVNAGNSEMLKHQLGIAAREMELHSGIKLRCFEILLAKEAEGASDESSTITRFAYQERIVLGVFSRMHGRAILADEVGLGKTVEAGLILTEYRIRRLVGRCLVLVPSLDLQDQWLRELTTKFLHNQESEPWSIGIFSARSKKDWKVHDTWIATYGAAVRNPERFLAGRWDMVIADEAHHLTNRSTKSYKLVQNLGSSRLLLLTATPLRRGADDLYSLASLIRPGLFGRLAQFRAQFSGNALADRKQRHALRTLLNQVLFRNTLLSVSGQIFTGRRDFHNPSIELTEPESNLYTNVYTFASLFGRRFRGILPLEYYSLTQMAASSAEAGLSAIRTMAKNQPSEKKRKKKRRSLKERIFCQAWLPKLEKLASDIDEPAKLRKTRQILAVAAPNKTLIFVEYVATAKMLGNRLGAPIIHGRIPRSKRKSILDAFREDPEQLTLVVTPGLAEGMNLEFCSVLVNYDLPWNPMRIEQRIGRIQRMGQSRSELQIYSLAARDTIEEEIRDALLRKVTLFRRAVGEIGLDLASLDHGRAITRKLREIIPKAKSESDLLRLTRSFIREILSPAVSEQVL